MRKVREKKNKTKERNIKQIQKEIAMWTGNQC